MKTSIRFTAMALALSLIALACGGSSDGGGDSAAVDPTPVIEADSDAGVDAGSDPEAEPSAEAEVVEDDAQLADVGDEGCPTLILATYDSFAVSDGLFDAFTDETCIAVRQVAGGDAGQLVSAAILTKDNPTADVMFGIDNTFLQRGLDAELFAAYESPLLSTVDPAVQLDPEHRVTPIDYSDVCVNYWVDALPGDAPATLDDLIDPANAGQFVTMNPETSSPGFAFLLATIVRYGDDWENYWASLVDNNVSITSGWSEAYFGEFTAAGGDRSIVTSYASSPPVEVIFADPPVERPPTEVLYDSCFRQVEFAGILAGTDYPASSQQLIDFLLSTTFQEDIPLNMFVYPTNQEAALPDVFVEFGPLAENPAQLTPAEIEANRAAWTDRWVEIVLG